MGKAGRLVFVIAPMVLLGACFGCQLFVFMGQLNKDSSILNSLYFFKADTKDFNRTPGASFKDIPNTEVDNRLIDALQNAAKVPDGLKDFYQVGLWNYCEGTRNDKGEETITYCSPRKANFWFNPIEAWEMKNVKPEDIFTDELKKGLDAYQKVVKFAFAAWIISITLTLVESIVCMFAILSRWGSLATTIISTVKTIFLIAAAGSSTGVYAALAGVFHTVLEPLNIKSHVGGRMLSVVWLAVAFSIAAGFFWLISSCCCSGQSGHKKVSVEKTPYTYERVASPYMGANEGANSHAMAPVGGHGTSGKAFEPYRQV